MSWLFWLLIGLGLGLIILGFYYFNVTRRNERSPFPLDDVKQDPLAIDSLDDSSPQSLGRAAQEQPTDSKIAKKLEPRMDHTPAFDELGVSSVRLRPQDEAEAVRLATTVRTRRASRFSYKNVAEDTPTSSNTKAAASPPNAPQKTSTAIPPAQANAPKQSARAADSIAPPPQANAAPDVIPLYLVARQPTGFAGALLVHLLAQYGFEFGEMSVYHYTDAHGEVLFSLMNGVAPGTFDPNTLPAQSTPALALFLRLPIARQPNLALEQFLELAYHMANTLDARILDEQREELSTESVDRMRTILIDD